MQKIIGVACVFATASIFAAGVSGPADVQAAVPQAFLGELCSDVSFIANRSLLRISLSSAGTSWQLNGKWENGPESPGPIIRSVAVSGVMAREGNDFDISLNGNDFVNDNDPFEFAFHARVNSSGNGTWKMRAGSGFVTGPFNLSRC